MTISLKGEDMKKKIIGVLLCVAMTSTLMAGCGTSSNESSIEETTEEEVTETADINSTSDNSEEADPFGKYDDPITMTAMTTIATTASSTDYENSLWTQKFSDAFNINIEYEYLTSDSEQYDNRVSLMLASGDIPDVMNVSLTQMYQMIDAGLLEPLTDVWDEYASEQTVDAMTADSTFSFDVATVDGELYGIPWVTPTVETTHALFINEKWRKDNNLPEPDTWENFETLIYAFANDDPNGNGEKDEYGIGLTKELWDTGFEATSIANAFGAYPNAWILNDNGEVVYGSVQPEMKTVLEKLAQYYADGLIDPEFIVKDYETEAELVVTEQLGAMFGIQWTGLMGSCLQSLYENSDDPDSLEWEVYPIPSVDGNETSPIVYENSDTWLVVRAGYEYPEAVVKIANYMHYMGLGPQGEGPDGHPELALEYEEWEDMWNNDSYRLYSPETEHGNIDRWTHWFQAMEDGDTTWIDANYLAQDQYYAMLRYQEDGSQMTNNFGEQDITAASWQFAYETCGETFMYALDQQEKDNLTYDVRGAFVSDTMLESQAALEDLELETFTNIITGQADIDEFDDFVETWNTLGGEQITEEINEFYQELNS